MDLKQQKKYGYAQAKCLPAIEVTPLSLNARKSALSILNTVMNSDKTLDNILDGVFDKYPEADKREKALLFTLVYGVLRWKSRLDWIIGYYSKTKLNKIDPKVLNILRMGLFQILFLNRIPVSAAVNTSVDLTKRFAAPWVVRYVNAVLRKAAKGIDDVPFPDRNRNPVFELAVTKSFPEWLMKRWVDRFGVVEAEELCDAVNEIPPITLRTNSLKTNREKLSESISKHVKTITNTPFAPLGVSLTGPELSIPGFEAFQRGWFQVQDEAAQLVSHLLNPKPGETVLDACAGLGGKTGHMAQLMKNSGTIIAVDRDDKKLEKLKLEMIRLGVSIVSTRQQDLSLPLPQESLPLFDGILLDAPCSSLGVLRRNPDIKWSMHPHKIEVLKKVQVQMLNQMARFIKPSGRIVYAVCSTETEENEMVIKEFLKNHNEFAIEKDADKIPEPLQALLDTNGYIKTFPHHHHMDSFFSVLLKRTT